MEITSLVIEWTEMNRREMGRMMKLPKARKRRFLQRDMVQISVAKLWNLIMMNLQMARARVRKMDTVWIITVKLMWKSMKIPQPRDIWQNLCVTIRNYVSPFLPWVCHHHPAASCGS